MKYLALDFGKKKIGLAKGDGDLKIAFPYKVLYKKTNDNKDIINDIINIIKKENIDEMIIGKSLNHQNKENSIEIYTESFINDFLKEYNIQIHRIDERFTTSLIKNAYNIQKKDDDSSAAAIILQSYLDRNNK